MRALTLALSSRLTPAWAGSGSHRPASPQLSATDPRVGGERAEVREWVDSHID